MCPFDLSACTPDVCILRYRTTLTAYSKHFHHVQCTFFLVHMSYMYAYTCVVVVHMKLCPGYSVSVFVYSCGIVYLIHCFPPITCILRPFVD